MPNSYTQIYMHYVFATKHRMQFIKESQRQDLYDYIGGIIKGLNCFLHCIGGMEDHIHLLVGLNARYSIPEFAKRIKERSSKHINESEWSIRKFQWQEGYGAFSVSHSNLPKVREYIQNQAEHHKRYSFLEEYEKLLQKHEVDYDKRYLLEE